MVVSVIRSMGQTMRQRRGRRTSECNNKKEGQNQAKHSKNLARAYGFDKSRGAALKRLLRYQQSLHALRSEKATPSGSEAMRTIKRGHIHQNQPGVLGEIQCASTLSAIA